MCLFLEMSSLSNTSFSLLIPLCYLHSFPLPLLSLLPTTLLFFLSFFFMTLLHILNLLPIPLFLLLYIALNISLFLILLFLYLLPLIFLLILLHLYLFLSMILLSTSPIHIRLKCFFQEQALHNRDHQESTLLLNFYLITCAILFILILFFLIVIVFPFILFPSLL